MVTGDLTDKMDLEPILPITIGTMLNGEAMCKRTLIINLQHSK